MKKLKVKLIKSPINRIKRHKLTLRALGLTKLGQERVLPDNGQVRGMVKQVSYMIKVEVLGATSK